MNTEKIGYIEAIALISIVMTNKIILNTPKDIISTTGSSAWINSLLISIIAILLAWFIGFLFKNFHGKDILDVSEFLGGKFLKIIIGLSYLFFLLIVPMLVIKTFSENLQTIYFETSPTIYILLFFLVTCAISNCFSLKVIAKTNLIIAPVVFISIIVILVSSIQDFTIERIFPIMGYGIKETFFSGLSNIYAFSSISYLLFLNPFLSNSHKFKKISIISIIISGVYLFLSVLCILLSLPYTMQSGESFSLYLLTRNIEYGRFIQRMDAIFIFIWIISTISYISIAIYFSLHIIKKLTNIVDTSSMNYSINLFILSLILSFANLSNKLGEFFRYISLILIFGISILILVLANLKLRALNKKKGTV